MQSRGIAVAVLCSIVLNTVGCVTPRGGYGSGYSTPASRPVTAQRVTCSGCGGSGKGAAFLSGQGYSPSTPGFKDSACPRCNGRGWVYQ
jgi:hypothetical protein